ncbi:MAG: superoxide dismutase family protein [Anaerolineales bacterium]|nr:superoxide dismutase family protein [Anaerolineales bacterium]
MKLNRLILVALLLVALVVALGVMNAPARAGGPSAKAKLYDAAGQRVGEVKFSQEDDGTVMVKVKVNGLSAGFHGFHVHSVGMCTPPFTSAGGHFNPGGQSHPAHAADMPVLLVNADSNGEARFKTDRFTVAALFDADGSAVIVHAGPDNYANIPTRYVAAPDATTLATGDAGSRAACGVVEGGD